MINADDEVSLAYLLEPTFQVENTEGRPLTGGYIEVYLHGTRTKYYCYSDWNGSLHPFKIPLDSLGSNIILASPAHAYDIYVYNKYGTLVMSRYNVVPVTVDGVIIKDVEITGTDGSVKVDRTEVPNGVQYDLSVNTEKIATKDEIINKQDQLTPGNNIIITDNIISATGIPTKTSELENDSGFITSEAGDAIDLTNNTISVKYGKGLELNSANELQAMVAKGLYFTSDGKLTTEEPEENFIDITDEWEFVNGFRLQYAGALPGYGNNMKIMYSPVSDTVKFINGGRINRSSGFSDNSWYVMLQYKGDRFYTTYNAPDPTKFPILMTDDLIVGTNDYGTTNSSLVKFAYVGAGYIDESECGIAIQKFMGNDTYIYGTTINGTIFKVFKKV